MRYSRQAINGQGVEVADNNVHTLELHMLLDTESASSEGPAN